MKLLLHFRPLLFFALLLPALTIPNVSAAGPLTAASTGSDWPTYQHDAARSGLSSDTALSTANAAQLGKLWSLSTYAIPDPSGLHPHGGLFAAQPAIVNGIAYVGAWDGYEYAIDAATGGVLWSTFIGITNAPACNPPKPGITSSATVAGGVVYVGGGDSNWYALSASTGAILWSVPTGDNSATGGHYNWASPLLVNGFAYVGIASECDNPLVQGLLLKVDLSSHQIVGTTKLVPDGQTGGGIWTSPTLDPATNIIYVTTGTKTQSTQIYTQAIVSINASTMAVIGSWTIPAADAVIDSDWGTSPTLFTDSSAHQRVFAINKNGYGYAFDRANLPAGPVWRDTLNVGGDCPTCGNGSVSTSVFANGAIYAAGGNTSIGGVGYQGVVRAINPDTGAFLWEHGEQSPVIPASIFVNGLLVVGAGPLLEVLDASNGTRLWSYSTGKFPLFAPSVISGNIILQGTAVGTLTGFSPSSPGSPPPDPNCPVNWTCQDVGSPTPGGLESVSAGQWSIQAGGTGIGGATSDSFRLLTTPSSGDTQVTADLAALPSGQAGLMIRQSSDPTSPYYALIFAAGKLQVQYRTAFGGATTVVGATPYTLPRYLEVQRSTDKFIAAASPDGVTYTALPGTSVILPMPSAILAGLAVSSQTNASSVTARLQAIAVGALGAAPNPPASANPCPASWSCVDVGNPPRVGDQTLGSSGTWKISGSGADINGYNDQFRYVYQTQSGDGTLSAHLATLTSTGTIDAYAKSGLLYRTTTDSDSQFYGAFMTSGHGILIEYRANPTTFATAINIGTGTYPAYLKIGRAGSTFTAYTSLDGVAWTLIGGSAVTINVPASLLAGPGVTAHNNAQTDTATISGVHFSATPPPLLCPAPWTCTDVGNPPAGTGSQTLNGGTWNVQAGGGDIWTTSDQFHYIYQTQASATDVSIATRVVSQSNTNAFAKAGVMLRATSDPTSAFYDLVLTPSNGLEVQMRSSAGVAATGILTKPATPPLYLKVVRSSSTFAAYTSADGVTWTILAGSSTSIPALAGALEYGLATTSHAGPLTNDTFDHLVSSQTAPPPTCPTPWSCANVGNPPAAGDQSLSAGVWTLMSNGFDIWGTTDQFHYVYQPLAADGSISAQVTSQTNTDPWAKAGVMLRTDTTPGSIYYAFLATPGNGLSVQYRSLSGGATSQILLAGTVPAYLKAGRAGDTYTAYTSNDGKTWLPLGGSSVSLPQVAGTAMLAGLVATAHGATQAQDTFATVTLSGVTPPPVCPATWTCTDVGAPPATGNQGLNGSTWTVQSTGYDLAGTSDQFHLIDQTVAADTTLSANVTSQTNTDPFAKAGVILRVDTTPGSIYYGLFMTPGNGVVLQYRTSTGGTTSSLTTPGTVPLHLRVRRSGNIFTAYTSPDDVTWTLIAGSTLTIALPANTSLLAGLALTTHSAATAQATFAGVTITNTAPPPCPAPWSCADVGSPTLVGDQTLSGGTWTISGTGTDIAGASDQFHYVYRPLNGNGTLTTRITSQGNTDPFAKAGVMFRATTDPSSPFYALFMTPSNGLALEYRTAQGSSAVYISVGAATPPLYLRIARFGDVFLAYTSSDGVTWTMVPNSALVIDAIPTSADLGLAVTSHNASNSSIATFDNVTFVTTTPAPPQDCPTSWTCADLGNPVLGGGALLTPNWIVFAAGAGAAATSDQIHYIYQTQAGDGGIAALISTQGNTSANAQAGVMLRATSDPASPFYSALLTPGHGIVIIYRPAAGGAAVTLTSLAGSIPTYLEVVRSANTFTAYTSVDGASWSPVPGSGVSMTWTSSILAGVAVSSLAVADVDAATFSNVALVAAPAPPVCPTSWTCTDIGTPAIAGSQTLNGTTWTLQGAGSDIVGSTDQLHYVYQTLSADGSLSERLVSQSNTSGWAKTGVMFRASTAPNAVYYALLMTPSHGLQLQYRTAIGANTTTIAMGALTLPNYLRIVKTGNSFAAYTSTDGSTWTLLANSTVTLANLNSPLLEGMAITSHNVNRLGTATFDSLNQTASATPVAPAALATPSPSPSPSPSACASPSPSPAPAPAPNACPSPSPNPSPSPSASPSPSPTPSPSPSPGVSPSASPSPSPVANPSPSPSPSPSPAPSPSPSPSPLASPAPVASPSPPPSASPSPAPSPAASPTPSPSPSPSPTPSPNPSPVASPSPSPLPTPVASPQSSPSPAPSPSPTPKVSPIPSPTP